MSDIIKLLPETVANQIAAGEIASKPSYIVKELLDNSIDAGATKIEVRVVDGGRSLIQVTDNGKGMSPTDARMAFEKHATSKISCIEDLDKLQTMGFRGEALNAISTVAEVELRTRPKDAELGTKICIKGGNLISVENCVCPEGTTFIIMDLFFNTPAKRRKLMSKDYGAEKVYREVKTEFERVALVYPKVAMALYHDQKLYKDLLSSPLKERILAISSKRTRNDLLPIHSNNQKVKIDGFIGKPDSAKQRANQYLFVNNRYMEHSVFKNAIIQTFKPYITSNESDKKEPNYYIYFEVAPEAIDVNISPQKTEISFLDEELIEIFLRTLIRSILSANAVLPTIDFNNEQTVQIPPSVEGYKEPSEQKGDELVVRRHVFMGNSLNKAGNQASQGSVNTSTPASTSREKMPSFASERKIQRFQPTKTSSKSIDWSNLGKELEASKAEASTDLFGHKEEQGNELNLKKVRLSDLSLNAKGAFEAQSYCLLNSKYLLTATDEQVLLIHIERAYERVFYERFKAQMSATKLEVSALLFPEDLNLSATERELLLKLEELLKRFGFAFTHSDNESKLIEAPDLLQGQELTVLHTVLTSCEEVNEELGEAYLLELLAKKYASIHSAEYAHQQGEAKLAELLRDLFDCEEYSISPSGKAIIKSLSNNYIESLFIK